MNDVIKKIECNICRFKDYKSIFKTTNFDIYEKFINKKKKQLKVWYYCNNCKCYFQIKKIQIPNLSNYYKKNYRDKNKKEYEEKFKEIINLPSSKSESFNRYERLLNFLKIKKISKKNIFKKCLDVGCGFGVYAYFLRKISTEVEGNDLHNNAKYLSKYGIKFLNKDFFLLKNKYSLITSNFIAEHLEDPMIFVKKSYDLLYKKGILYIEVPSDKAFKYQKKNHDVFNSTHNFIFSKNTLKYMMEKNNFKILKFDQGLNKRNYYYISVYGQKI
jgi:2-polyprenyl-3-methyl-5-hydroxy-6-metoxy-1,4-benzoquinol methylase